jgi:exodeoxyribonuclease I
MSSFFFYDLETSGVSPREARIMQFAGQRTDLNLKPIGNPYNILIKITEDVLPDPYAILVTGITPQKTLTDGITETEFVKIFLNEIVRPDTIFVGFNSIRFDDEFMRFLLWRNFADAYEWQWKNGCSRWDIMDVARMTRALRPNGIKWPFRPDGVPTVSLESLTSVNKISHSDAHDALSDVNATIEVARMINQNQPKLFEYLLSIRGKKEVAKIVESGQPFVYTSGKYANEFEKTTIVQSLGPHPDKQGVLVYDLRHDPTEWQKMSPEKLADAWKWKKDSKQPRVPVKTLQFNRCPSIAPLGVLDKESSNRLKLDTNNVQKNRKMLDQDKSFAANLREALKLLNQEREQSQLLPDEAEVDARLYDGFIGDNDKKIAEKVREANTSEISKLANGFKDVRLKQLLPLYKARNYPASLSAEERADWSKYKNRILTSGGEKSRLSRFSRQLVELSEGKLRKLTDDERYILEELRLYAESILPEV